MKFYPGKGDVDHYRAKSEYPQFTYHWKNYIWSCKPCNQHKGEFDDPKYPIFNPCNKDDCNKLEFIEDFGQFCLFKKYENNTLLKKRFENTVKYTLLNSESICNQRRDIITLLRGYFVSINNLMKAINSIEEMQIGEGFKADIQTEIEKNIERIRITTNSESFKLLISDELKLLTNEYQEISELL
uniref:hypothetical protein n=1 Tax=Vibrio parahaemolyticus TaxID=670 RepID=UPI0030D01DA5